MALGHVRDDHIDDAGDPVFCQSEDAAGVRPLVLAQTGIVGPHEQEARVRKVGRGLSLIVPVVEPLLLKRAGGWVDGVVLDL